MSSRQGLSHADAILHRMNDLQDVADTLAGVQWNGRILGLACCPVCDAFVNDGHVKYCRFTRALRALRHGQVDGVAELIKHLEWSRGLLVKRCPCCKAVRPAHAEGCRMRRAAEIVRGAEQR